MKLNLYYAPYPSQIFSNHDKPINTERPYNPKSAMTTLATGVRAFASRMGYDYKVEIIDTMINGERTWYKTIPYGPLMMDCYRLGRPFEAFDDKIREGDVHGITSNHTNAAQIVADLASYIKGLNPRSLVVIGGTDATARPEYYLKRGADVIVKREGEYVFARILASWYKGESLEGIPSVCTRNNPAGNPAEAKSLIDMDALEPMSLDLVDDISIYTDTAEGPPPEGVKSNYICFETSRGCAWACSFCTAPSRGKYRYMSPKSVERHFKYFKSLGIKTIVWQEDNPLSRVQQTGTGRYVYDKGREEVLEIFHMAREYGFAWEFANGLEFGKFRPKGNGGEFDRELMDALLWSKQSPEEWLGCYRVQIPLDNLDLEEKKRFPKLLDFEGQLEVLTSMLVDYNVIHQTYDLFIGYPEHDRAVLDRFTEGCLRIKDTLTKANPAFYPYFNVFNLALLPGARDYERLKHLLAFDIEKDPEVTGIFLSAINTKHFTYWETYQNRVEMCNLLNGQEMIGRYDGIHTGMDVRVPNGRQGGVAMRVNLYYAPYPSQVFEGEDKPLSPVRVWNPKSALVTLVAGTRNYLKEWGIDARFEIIDTQVDGDARYYKSIPYGPRLLRCFRVGGEFDSYDRSIMEADIHGVSNNYTNSAGIVADFIRHIKAVKPNAYVVVGGMDATARPEFYIGAGADVIVMLEGEYVFAKIIEAKALKRPLQDSIPCQAKGGGLVVQGSQLLDMNEMAPMSFDLVRNLESYNDTGEGIPPPTVKAPFACFETSRGCYQRCSYCATPMRGRYRYMTPKTVEKHLVHLKSVGIRNILFQEDNILSRMQRGGSGDFLHDTGRAEVIEIFQMARDLGFSWEFANGIEFGKLLDMGTLDTELMKAMFWSDQSSERWLGCYRLQIPLEVLSGTPDRRLPKLRAFDQQIEILKSVLDHGIRYLTFNVIIGNDGDDDRKIEGYLERSLYIKDVLLAHNPGITPYFNIFNRTLLPGTLDFRQKKHLLAFDIEKDPEIISVYLSPMGTESMSYYELVQRRIMMTTRINGELIDQYDGIYNSVDKMA